MELSIYPIRMGFNTVYAVKGEGVILIDGGFPRRLADFKDGLMNLFPLRLNPGLPIWGDDIHLVKNSWKKLLEMGAKTAYPAHGKPFSAQVMRKLVE